jgi:hypothetical protein
MNIKSVIAGEYTAPPAHGPMMHEIWGITPANTQLIVIGGEETNKRIKFQSVEEHATFYSPDASTFIWNTSAYPPRESMPS